MITEQNYFSEINKVNIAQAPEHLKTTQALAGNIYAKNSYIAAMPPELKKALEFYKQGDIEISYLHKKVTASEIEKPRAEAEDRSRIETAMILARHRNEKVTVLPEIKPEHWAYNFYFADAGGKVPDFRIKGEYWEIESYEGKYKLTKIGRMIKSGQQQADYVVIKLRTFVEKKKILDQFDQLLNNPDFTPKFKELIIIDKNGNIIIRLSYLKKKRI